MVVVDSSVWIDYMRQIPNWQTAWLEHNSGHIEIGLTDLILCEVLQGIGSPAEFLRAQARLGSMTVLNSGGEEIASASALNYRALLKKGMTVRTTIDCIIATVCIAGGHTLLHNDRDFDGFEKHLGLKVVRPVKH